jgi:hypothetical protein
MATLATGNTTGGQKKSSGVSLVSSLKETWAKVRDDSDESCSWVLAGFSPGSKTNIEVKSLLDEWLMPRIPILQSFLLVGIICSSFVLKWRFRFMVDVLFSVL